MGGRRILTDEQIDEMAEWREQGLSIARIAARFARRGVQISQGSVSWQLLRIGADAPNAKPRPLYQRNALSGIRARPFTREEDERLLALEAEGVSVSFIAKQLGRRHNSIRGRLYTLARHDARLESQAA